jgi:tRNA dimethylallyltransferase
MNQIISISGPTGIGKTKVAIELAKKLNAEIISFDSRQIYSELSIGVARPSKEELVEVKHHLIGHKSIHDKYSAQDFVKEVYGIINIEQVTNNNKCNDTSKISNLTFQTYILVGGTGFFLFALENGLDELPDISDKTRDKVQREFLEHGLEFIQNRVQEIDPISYANMEITNPRRLQRILEIWEETGEVYSELIARKDAESQSSDEDDFVPLCLRGKIKNIVLDIPREILYNRINQRVDEMIKNGLVEEAKAHLPYRDLNALNTVGYKELFPFFDGEIYLEEAIDKIKQHSRNYAKRQITWNRKYLKDALWINHLDDKNYLEKIENYVLA